MSAETDKVLVQALDAFWATIAQAYSEATTGDLPAEAEYRLEDVAREAMETWLRYNLPLPEVGTRVTLVRDVDRFPDFVGRRGETGTVVESFGDGEISVKLDNIPDGARAWDGCLHWSGNYDQPWWEDLRI